MKKVKLDKIDQFIPIYSPRTAYHLIRKNDENLLTDLTLNFDPFTINVLKTEFGLRKMEMDIVDFIQVLKEHLSNWQRDITNREEKLIRCLALLFDEIDLNDNKIMEWDEFTSYVIEKATVINNIKAKNDEIKTYTKSEVIYIPTIDRIAFFEENTDEVFFLNYETGVLNQKSLKVTLEEKEKQDPKKKETKGIKKTTKLIKKEKKAMILDMIFIKEPKKYNVLITSSNDGAVRSWRYSSNGFVPANSDEKEDMIFAQAQVCLAWDSVNEILYCGQRDGTINIWEKQQDAIIGKLDKETKKGHSDVIMDMIALPKLQFLASASLDKSIILWDTITWTQKWLYTEHTRGVVSLSFNEALILLFSAGFDHEIFVWNPYIGTSIYKIAGHNAPLVGVKAIDGTTQVVSIDQEGVLKVWDIKKFNCVQTINIDSTNDKHRLNPQAFCVIPKPLKLSIAGRTVMFYDYDINYNPTSVDEYGALCAKFLPQHLQVLTPGGNKIKVWSILTGEVMKIYSDIIAPTEVITCFTLDNYNKRFLLGDSRGEVGVFNVTNGAKLKALMRHHAEINYIIHVDKENLIVTASIDSVIRIHEDKIINESDVIRTIELKDMILSSVAFDVPNKILLLGTQSGSISFWEMETGKKIANHNYLGYEEITCMITIPDLPYLIISNSSGKVSVIALPTLIFRFSKVFTFQNTDPITKQNTCVHSISFCTETHRLFIADERYNLKCFDLSDLIKVLIIEKGKSAKVESSTTLFIKPTAPPKLPQIDIREMWHTSAHTEQIRFMEFIQSENIIFTTSHDKRVKIWNAGNGSFVDSFQQNYDKSEIRPIAIKNTSTEDIYTPSFARRLDYKTDASEFNEAHSFKDEETIKKEKEKKLLAQQKSQATVFEEEKGAPKRLRERLSAEEVDGMESGFQEEFNPFYLYDQIDQEKLESDDPRKARSCDWKLEIPFDKYYLKQRVKARESQGPDDVEMKEGKEFLTTKGKEVEYDDKWKDAKPAFLQEELAGKKSGDSKKKQDLNIKKIMVMDNTTGKEAKKLSADKSDVHLVRFRANLPRVCSEGVSRLETWRITGQQCTCQKKVLVNAIKFSVIEMRAAYELAAALTNYDPDDVKSLKFTNIVEKRKKSLTEKEKKQIMSELRKGKDRKTMEYNIQEEVEEVLRLPRISASVSRLYPYTNLPSRTKGQF